MEPTGQNRKCPFCGEEILPEALKCKHCHELMPEAVAAAEFENAKQICESNIRTYNRFGNCFGKYLRAIVILAAVFGPLGAITGGLSWRDATATIMICLMTALFAYGGYKLIYSLIICPLLRSVHGETALREAQSNIRTRESMEKNVKSAFKELEKSGIIKKKS